MTRLNFNRKWLVA